ncbi:PspC domain-containing protein [Micromonospora sp. WMMD882]|uniref:PspC domain-containing protein n=1 Tax=Micromonospora sp. WMMD882 TaxID=3015151 RepID=UPI00248C162C|nr:PspC domain-containing protein [Micromonospora sp. WMMD882]WBB79250.1 PspC domain-containing protein [Micromonospora sp. WMMD882]
MTEETARSPRPEATRPDGPPPPAAAPAAQPAAAAPAAGDPSGPPPPAGPSASSTPPAGGAAPPPPGAGPPPPGYDQPTAPGGVGFTSRYGLVRPRSGRYLAGVCAAIGRATNTDPVLWRVLLAVLGFFGGVGILVYVSAWLIIPGEGDSASPVESMLGRGRSSMSPVTVIVLSILVAVSFGYIVTDAFRAVLLGAAILVGGALLLNRDQPGRDRRVGSPPPADPAVPHLPGPVPPVSHPAPGHRTPPAAPGSSPSGSGPGLVAPAWGPAAAAPPVGVDAPRRPAPAAPFPAPGGPFPAPGGPMLAPGGSGGTPPVVGAPAPTGYRPPFAPHGPYAGAGPTPPAPPAPPARPPKRPRDRSPLGAITFSLVFLACGVVAALDLLGLIRVGASAYFAAALATVGLGLLVGAWFGRARWLIALGLVTAAALGFATAAESFADWRSVNGSVTWAPASYADLAPRYQHTFGDAVLDLRAVDFTGQDGGTTVVTTFGDLTVRLPPTVDVTVRAEVNAGEATLFGNRSDGLDRQVREVSDLGGDGPGGGALRLLVQVNAGTLEVTR